MYDSLLEAYGHAVWFSNKILFAPQFSPLPGGKKPKKNAPFRVKMSKKLIARPKMVRIVNSVAYLLDSDCCLYCTGDEWGPP